VQRNQKKKRFVALQRYSATKKNKKNARAQKNKKKKKVGCVAPQRSKK
jgi:hypothetical protein